MNAPIPDPFLLTAGSTGMLLIHGLTGSPAEMRQLGDYLHAQGFTVSAPLLPGHGTTPADLRRRRWPEWIEHAEIALAELRERCETVFVAGLSMGALVALTLAARHGTQLAGAVVYAPALHMIDRTSLLIPLAKYFIKEMPKGEDDFVDKEALWRLWNYEVYPLTAVHEFQKLIQQSKRILPQVTCPLLILHSTGDKVICPTSAQFVYARVSSADKEVVLLHNSGHVLTLDAEWETVAERTLQFIRQRASASVQRHGG